MSRTTSKDKQAAGITWTGAWSGLAGGNEVQLENASNLGYAAGTFGDNFGAGKPLANGSGAGKANLKSGVDFTYNSKLNATGGSDVDIYDDNASGAFTASHYMRVVNNAKNITDVTGLNIQNIYAKSLAGLSNTWASPPATDVYIDPEQGKLVLPRPNHWSKCQSGGYGTPEIGSVTTSYVVPAYNNVTNAAGKFGNSLYYYLSGAVPDNTWTTMKNVVDTSFPSKGTVSFWASAVGAASAFYYGAIFFCGDQWAYTGYSGGNYLPAPFAYFPFAVGISTYYTGSPFFANPSFQVWLSGSLISGYVPLAHGVWYHIYAVWDSAKGLAGGKSIRVWVDGANEISSTADLPSVGANLPSFTLASSGNTMYNCWAYDYLDNPKYWNHVVSEDPSFEYNGGSGREDALHYIYGAGNGYKPQITGVNNGVGYYYLATSGSPAISAGSGGDETETLKSSTTTSAAGSFGDSGILCDNSFAALNTTSHYNYDKRLDASIGEDPTDGFGATAGGVIDTGAAGALGVGKYVRLVANALNVRDTNYPTAGYGGLKIYAKSLAGVNKGAWASPNKDRMYVDPTTGNYSFPRPSLWCKLESSGDCTTPTIAEIPPSSFSGLHGFQAGKFGNCAFMLGPNCADPPWMFRTANEAYYNFNHTIPTKGTVSFWVNVNRQWSWNEGYSGGSFVMVGGSHTMPGAMLGGEYAGTNLSWGVGIVDALAGFTAYCRCVIIFGGAVQAFLDVGNYVWYHIYAVWDYAKGLTGGKSIRMWINGGSELSSTADLPAATTMYTSMCCGRIKWNEVPQYIFGNSFADNIKYWNHVVSEDPAWEYNAGAGREDAMHYIYGAANSYKPNLAAASSGVGYYRGGANTRQCIITV